VGVIIYRKAANSSEILTTKPYSYPNVNPTDFDHDPDLNPITLILTIN